MTYFALIGYRHCSELGRLVLNMCISSFTAHALNWTGVREVQFWAAALEYPCSEQFCHFSSVQFSSVHVMWTRLNSALATLSLRHFPADFCISSAWLVWWRVERFPHRLFTYGIIVIVIISRPHRMHRIDAVRCYKSRTSRGLYVCAYRWALQKAEPTRADPINRVNLDGMHIGATW